MQFVLFLHWAVLNRSLVNVSVFHAAAVTSVPLSMLVPRDKACLTDMELGGEGGPRIVGVVGSGQIPESAEQSEDILSAVEQILGPLKFSQCELRFQLVWAVWIKKLSIKFLSTNDNVNLKR